MKEGKRKNLKPKEEEFLDKLIINDNNGTKTAQEVFGIENPLYGALKAHRILQKPEAIEVIEEKRISLREALEKKGVTGEKIAQKVDELLEAKKDSGDPDYQAIDKGIAHAVKIRGDVPEDNSQPTTNYNFIFSAPVQEKIRDIDAQIKELLVKDTNDDQKT